MNQGFTTIADGGRCKWIRVYSNGDTYDTIYMHLSTSHGMSPIMYFYCGNEGNWLGDGVILPNAYDGNWHKFSFYINWNDGIIRGWYDVEVETETNYTKEWIAPDGQIGGGTKQIIF
jgi:hypothetical protein